METINKDFASQTDSFTASNKRNIVLKTKNQQQNHRYYHQIISKILKFTRDAAKDILKPKLNQNLLKLIATFLQTHHVYSSLKRRENGCFHVVSMWNTRGVFIGVHVNRYNINHQQNHQQRKENVAEPIKIIRLTVIWRTTIDN